MSLGNLLPLFILASSMVTALVIFLLPERMRAARAAVNFAGIASCLVLIAILLTGVYRGDSYGIRLAILPDVDFVLHSDLLSLLFLSLSGVLWGLTTIYAKAYLESYRNLNRFFGFFSLCVFATMGIALSGNLFTFLIFYELLTLTTYPLIAHKGNTSSIRAARIYLTYTLIGGAFLLVGIVWLKALAGPLDFVATGVLSGLSIDEQQLKIIFVFIIIGFGVKAALVPLHGWLPIAMAAPAPVSALLHAVAVVKAGAFGIVRVTYDVYGIEFAHSLGLIYFLAIAASITIVYGSYKALFQDDLKKRLAFSTVSQVSYITLGTAILGPIATVGGVVHLVHQGLMKITLFFCAGNLAETLGITKISQMQGAGKRMPVTMVAFTLAALGMIGIPPLAGFVSKWYLGSGALQADMHWVLIVLAISSILNAFYFLPIIYAIWFKPCEKQKTPPVKEKEQQKAHWMLVLPPVTTALLAILVGLFAAAELSPLSWATLIAQSEYLSTIADYFKPERAMSLWLLAPILFPLTGLSILPFLSKQNQLRLSSTFALLALVVALFAPSGESLIVPELFFGSVFILSDVNRLFLGLAAILWFLSAISLSSYMRDDQNSTRFCIFFVLAMGGNFGLILAEDSFGFISFFTLMSLASYGLVVHNGTEAAHQAGKSYIIWLIVGELLLFSGMVAVASLTPEFTEEIGWPHYLLVVGFGVKTGLFLTHFWLPLAHPVAPLPASALLSGIMVKAGLIGWLKFIPLGEVGDAALGNLLVWLGLAGAFFSFIVGYVQKNPKTLLAYSTISQMGIIAAVVGLGIKNPEIWPTLQPVLIIYAVYHALTKAALFFSVGIVPAQQIIRELRYFSFALVVIPALVMAGFPLTGGALAKLALKSQIENFTLVYTLITAASVGTALLMFRFLTLHFDSSKTLVKGRAGQGLVFAQASLVVLCLVAPFFLSVAKEYLATPFSLVNGIESLWPILTAMILYFLTRYLFGVNLERLPVISHAVFMPSTSKIACNLPEFAIKKSLSEGLSLSFMAGIKYSQERFTYFGMVLKSEIIFAFMIFIFWFAI